MHRAVGFLSVAGLLLGLAAPAPAALLLQAGVTEASLRPDSAGLANPALHSFTARPGQTVAVRLRLANNNPAISSQLRLYLDGDPVALDTAAVYRTVESDERSPISHWVVLVLPGEQAETLHSYELEPQFHLDQDAQHIPTTVRYRLTVESATRAQQLLLEAQQHQAQERYDDAIATYSRAIELRPTIADFYAQRGRAASLSAPGQAAADWETAARLYEQVGHVRQAQALRRQLQQLIQ